MNTRYDVGFSIGKILFNEYYGDKELVINKTSDKIIADGKFYNKKNRFEILRGNNIIVNTLGDVNCDVIDEIWEIIDGKIPKYSRKLIDFCPWILALYIDYDGDPYNCHGTIHIKDSVYWCEYNGGNDMSINGEPFFTTQRILFYTAMKYKQNFYKKKYNETIKEIPFIPGVGIEYIEALKRWDSLI